MAQFSRGRKGKKIMVNYSLALSQFVCPKNSKFPITIGLSFRVCISVRFGFISLCPDSSPGQQHVPGLKVNEFVVGQWPQGLSGFGGDVEHPPHVEDSRLHQAFASCSLLVHLCGRVLGNQQEKRLDWAYLRAKTSARCSLKSLRLVIPVNCKRLLQE